MTRTTPARILSSRSHLPRFRGVVICLSILESNINKVKPDPDAVLFSRAWFVGLWRTGYPVQVHSVRKILSIFRPFANSSTNLSKYLTFCVNGFSISSTR